MNGYIEMGIKLFRPSTITLIIVTTSYMLISKVLFDKIYVTSQVIVDEEFHLPLGRAYCRYDFNKWDPKVTTFPGLYLLSTLLFGYFNLCSTYWLRFVSLITSTCNVILFYVTFKSYNKEVAWKNIFSAINLSILPPLYFFSHIYYTDVSSIMITMLLLISARKEYHYLASFFGALAIMMRQTNVIWVGMLFGDFILKQLFVLSSKNNEHIKRVKISMKDVQSLTKMILTRPIDILKKTNMQLVIDCSVYMSVLCSFLLFVYWNGSIVVGDKTAHEATLHIVQMFYFATFTLLFGWPHFLSSIWPFFRFARRKRILMLALIGICLCIVHLNTLVHKYMLSDNRHYIFYIWNRFYGRYYLFRYGMIVVYMFAIHGILYKIWDSNDISFLLMYVSATILVLIMQKLIEFRYYLFPYILFRLQIKKTTLTILVLENLTYMAVNAFTFYMFFNKEIVWDDYDYPQRLIW